MELLTVSVKAGENSAATFTIKCCLLSSSSPYFISNLRTVRFYSLNLANWICFGDAEISHLPSPRVVWFHTDSHKKSVVFLTVAALGRKLRKSPQSKDNYWPAD